LTFEEPDLRRFPGLKLAMDAARQGGAAPIILNAANEVAVEAFLQRRIGFMAIIDVIAATLDAGIAGEPDSLEQVKDIDEQARALAQRCL
jgi:1-deoxy-D-xylulose-5-phosphate reductoisomerase